MSQPAIALYERVCSVEFPESAHTREELAAILKISADSILIDTASFVVFKKAAQAQDFFKKIKSLPGTSASDEKQLIHATPPIIVYSPKPPKYLSFLRMFPDDDAVTASGILDALYEYGAVQVSAKVSPGAATSYFANFLQVEGASICFQSLSQQASKAFFMVEKYKVNVDAPKSVTPPPIPVKPVTPPPAIKSARRKSVTPPPPETLSKALVDMKPHNPISAIAPIVANPVLNALGLKSHTARIFQDVDRIIVEFDQKDFARVLSHPNVVIEGIEFSVSLRHTPVSPNAQLLPFVPGSTQILPKKASTSASASNGFGNPTPLQEQDVAGADLRVFARLSAQDKPIFTYQEAKAILHEASTIHVAKQPNKFSFVNFRDMQTAIACFERIKGNAGRAAFNSQKKCVSFEIGGQAVSLNFPQTTKCGKRKPQSQSGPVTVTTCCQLRTIDSKPAAFDEPALLSSLKLQGSDANAFIPKRSGPIILTFSSISHANTFFRQLKTTSQIGPNGYPLVIISMQIVEVQPPSQRSILTLHVDEPDDFYFPTAAVCFSNTTNDARTKTRVFRHWGSLVLETVYNSSNPSLDEATQQRARKLIEYLRDNIVKLKQMADLHGCGFQFVSAGKEDNNEVKLNVFGPSENLSAFRDQISDIVDVLQDIVIPVPGKWLLPHKALLKNELEDVDDLQITITKQSNGIDIHGFGSQRVIDQLRRKVLSLHLSPIIVEDVLTESQAKALKAETRRISLFGDAVRTSVNNKTLAILAINEVTCDDAVAALNAWKTSKENDVIVTDRVAVASPIVFNILANDERLWLLVNQALVSNGGQAKQPPPATKVHVIVFKCKRGHVDKVKAAISVEIQQIQHRIASRKIVVTPGKLGLFGSEKFKAIIRDTPALNGVTIEQTKDALAVSGTQVRLVRFVRLPNGLCLEIRYGDIVNDDDVNCIVAAAGSRLQHGGGVAAQLSLAAGRSFVDDCNRYIAEHNEIPETQAVTFSAYDLNPVKHIIAAVAPVFFNTTSRQQALLNVTATFLSAFTEAHKLGDSRIATPALGARLFNNPVELVIEAFFCAVDQLPQGDIKTIRMTDADPVVIEAACKAFDARFAKSVDYQQWKWSNKVRPKQQWPKYQWFWHDGKAYEPYDEDCNNIIDSNYALRKPDQMAFEMLVSVSDSQHGRDYIIDFEKLKQFNKKTQFSRDIQSKDFVIPPVEQVDEDGDDDDAAAIVVDKVLQLTVQYLHEEIDKMTATFVQLLDGSIYSHLLPSKPSKVLTPEFLAQLKVTCTNKLLDVAVNINKEIVTLTLSGAEDLVKDMALTVLELISTEEDRQKAAPSKRPPHWTGTANDLEVALVPGSAEWQNVEGQLKKTLAAAQVKAIVRIQNQKLWDEYQTSVNKTVALIGADKAVTLNLFHGTRTTPPEQLYRDYEIGLNINYSAEGMWGRGIYFAVNASYSNSYAFTSADGLKHLMLCDVLVGDSEALPPTSSLRRPNLKPGTTIRYDSVTGQTGGSQVYIQYKNHFNYISYIISYQ